MTPQSSASPDNTPAADLSSVDSLTLGEISGRKMGEVLAINGSAIYFERFGEGTPVLLLHGGAATIESWTFQISALSKGYELIVPDARGHGRSRDVEGAINFKAMAADFCGLLDHLRLKEVAIVGWSDGAVTSFEMAMSRPDLVSKVVALGAHSRPEGMTDEFRAEVEGATAENFPDILKEGYKALSPDGSAHWPIVFEKLKKMWLNLPNFTEVELRSIACPVLLLVGETDIVRREESERLERIIPNARLKVMEGASHYAPVEVPDLVNAEITEFLKR